nr:NAD(P)H-dependent oxidoreductase [Streptococcus oralis]
MFNFSSPSLLKKWIDAILICSWFYGKKWGR